MINDTIYSRFAVWVDRNPDAVAIAEDGRTVTYGDLDAMADAILDKFALMRP